MPNFRLKSHCLICGLRTSISRDYKFTCSGSCQKEYIELRREQLQVPKICPTCGNIFYAKRLRTSKYCSKDCSKLPPKIGSDFSIFRRDNFRCIYCGKSSIEDDVKLHVEHIVPIAGNGLTSIDNLITACEECNQSKSSTPLTEQLKERVLSVLIKRNENISPNLKAEILKDIAELQPLHLIRVCRAKLKI